MLGSGSDTNEGGHILEKGKTECGKVEFKRKNLAAGLIGGKQQTGGT